jgi:hypothetical protein
LLWKMTAKDSMAALQILLVLLPYLQSKTSVTKSKMPISTNNFENSYSFYLEQTADYINFHLFEQNKFLSALKHVHSFIIFEWDRWVEYVVGAACLINISKRILNWEMTKW